MSELDYRVVPGGALRGRVDIPGDKSISHRALLLGSIAEGETRLQGLLRSTDVLASWRALEALGVHIEQGPRDIVSVQGRGLHGLQAPAAPLALGNSGTSARLLAGLLCAQPFDCVLEGDMSLSRRPMQRLVDPLQRMGASLRASEQGTLPLRISGGRALRGIDWRLPIASAQLKSCLLLAGLYAEGTLRLQEPLPSRDHTERMLERFACPLRREADAIVLSGGAQPQATELQVPADLSSAAFFLLGASIAPASELLLPGIGVNPTRRAVIDLLLQMGAKIWLENERLCGAEPVADLRVRTAPRLHAIDIPPEQVPRAIDELPALLIAAACARGQTRLRGARELRFKESDRIDAMVAGLRALGIEATAFEDGLTVRGGYLRGGVVDARGDHRIAMAFTMAGLVAQDVVRIRSCRQVETSFPSFAARAQAAGMELRVAPGDRARDAVSSLGAEG